MKYVKVLLIGLTMLGVLGVAGCYRNPSDVAVHKPGVYKGPADPLIAKLKSPELTKKLDDRARVAFDDR
ncbi:MAG: hypothetical protein P8Y64_12285 [Gammaproteobacteria bacterium]|jgi:hypothetical protein